MHSTQNTNSKQSTGHGLSGTQTSPYRDLEVRTTEFAKRIIRLCKVLPQNEINRRLIGQIVRSSGSIGANYREANEATGRKDFVYRLRIARKEAKETGHWLELVAEANPTVVERMQALAGEAREFRNIFSAIISKATARF